MPDSVQDDETASPSGPPASGLLDELGRFGRAARNLFGAQLQLLAAELGLARSAVSWLLLAALVATVAGVGLGLTLLGLAGVLLATWFGSWIWALAALLALEVLFLAGAVVLFRRCMHWMSLPVSRGEWHAVVRQVMSRAERRVEAEERERRP